MNRRAIAICGPGTVRSSRLRNVMTALPSRLAASYQVGTSCFFDILWLSMFLVYGVSLVQQCCTQKYQDSVYYSGLFTCLWQYLCDVIYDGVGYYFSHCHYLILCSTDFLCFIVIKNPFRDSHDFV